MHAKASVRDMKTPWDWHYTRLGTLGNNKEKAWKKTVVSLHYRTPTMRWTLAHLYSQQLLS